MVVGLPKRDAPDLKGPGFQAAVDIWGADYWGVQIRGGFQWQTCDTARADLATLGLQGQVWMDGMLCHAVLGLEARSETISNAPLETSYGRMWARVGLGFRGIFIPLPGSFGSIHFALGDHTIVPFTRYEWALPLTTRRAPGLVLPSSELSVQVGVRFNVE